tara:strand:+ start:2587 stop:2814 length:228 start_codon:yes stop_codon:yes gene_type:complete
MKISIIDGHLTTKDKKVVKYMINNKMKSGKSGKTNYYIKNINNNNYEIITQKKSAIFYGEIPKLRNYKSNIIIKH